MIAGNQIVFAPFRLDTGDERLYRLADGTAEPIVLRPKSFAVLRYLAEHPDRLVIKKELLDAVWPETAVSDTVLKVCIREIRQALGDDQKPWRFIETAHRRGYRFIATPTAADAAPPLELVGRAGELAQLESAFARAVAGERQTVFVTGEPGIGKTALVDAFLARAAAASVRIGRGQCLEQYGAGEAYMPVLDALTRLCRSAAGERVVAALRQHAPMWLAQMPGVVGAEERERLQREITGATRERMLRELSHALEIVALDAPLLIVLEDLHWSDTATVDLLAAVAGQRQPARLMLVGTYRPAEILTSGHPLKAVKQELQSHKRCLELAVSLLDERAVAEYVARRLPSAEPARWVHARTDGNPLFMVNVVDDLVERRLDVDDAAVPENIRQMIERQIDRLDAEQQRLLEAASVAGAEFSVAAVAAAIEQDLLTIEERCEELARRHQFLRASRAAEGYGFVHALHQNALYARVPPARRARLHQRIGEYEERAYGARAAEIAAELAMHFEEGRDLRRAVRYLQQAAENAARRFAHGETLSLARRALSLLASLPDWPERAQQELVLQATLAVPLAATQGYGAAEVESTYRRARELCHELGDQPQLFPILVGLSRFSIIRAELSTARQLGDQLLRLAEHERDPVLLVEAHWTLGVTLLNIGDFAAARRHLDDALSQFRAEDLGTYLTRYGHDPRAVCRSFLAWALWSLGDEARALDEAAAALRLARETAHPETLGFALFFNAWVQQLRHDSAATLELTAALLAHADAHGLVQWSAFGTSLHGWALAMEGQRDDGIAQMRRALEIYRAIGSEISRPHFLALLAEALALDGQRDEARAALDEAVAAMEKNGERYYEAEIRRLERSIA